MNDVVLAVCAGALRARLEERGQLPEGSLLVGPTCTGWPTCWHRRWRT